MQVVFLFYAIWQKLGMIMPPVRRCLCVTRRNPTFAFPPDYRALFVPSEENWELGCIHTYVFVHTHNTHVHYPATGCFPFDLFPLKNEDGWCVDGVMVSFMCPTWLALGCPGEIFLGVHVRLAVGGVDSGKGVSRPSVGTIQPTEGLGGRGSAPVPCLGAELGHPIPTASPGSHACRFGLLHHCSPVPPGANGGACPLGCCPGEPCPCRWSKLAKRDGK